jgi:hypothetical protein
MTSSNSGISSFLSEAFSAVDANASTATASVDISTAKDIVWTVENMTGTHATHITTMECSLDGTNWYAMPGTIGPGEGHLQVAVFARYIRFLVSTVEGAASTIDISCQGK